MIHGGSITSGLRRNWIDAVDIEVQCPARGDLYFLVITIQFFIVGFMSAGKQFYTHIMFDRKSNTEGKSIITTTTAKKGRKTLSHIILFVPLSKIHIKRLTHIKINK